jgi:hypothetical protein
MIGSLLVNKGDADEIEQHLGDALSIFARSRDVSGILLTLAGFALTADMRGEREQFLRLGGFVEKLRDETGTGLIDTPVEYVQAQLPTRPTDAAELETWGQGRLLTTEEAISLALGN